jgi:hypothetical protein
MKGNHVYTRKRIISHPAASPPGSSQSSYPSTRSIPASRPLNSLAGGLARHALWREGRRYRLAREGAGGDEFEDDGLSSPRLGSRLSSVLPDSWFVPDVGTRTDWECFAENKKDLVTPSACPPRCSAGRLRRRRISLRLRGVLLAGSVQFFPTLGLFRMSGLELTGHFGSSFWNPLPVAPLAQRGLGPTESERIIPLIPSKKTGQKNVEGGWLETGPSPPSSWGDYRRIAQHRLKL